MHGWEEMVQKVAKLYHEIPADERETYMIYWRQTPMIDVVKAWRELILERRDEQLGSD